MYYKEYWSLADGGDTIAGKLFVPLGEPPEQGWPVRVWLYGFGGPGLDFWQWPFYGNNWRTRGYAAHYHEHPEVSGLRCLIADTFMPSVAHIMHFLFLHSMEFPPGVASADIALWPGPIWFLADYNGWDKPIFFTQQTVELFDSLAWTPVGMLALMRSAQLEPPEVSDVGPLLLDAVRNSLCYEPHPTGNCRMDFQ